MTDPQQNEVDSTFFDRISASRDKDGASEALNELISVVRESGDFHKLFDATMLKEKFNIGAPLGRPTSLEDVPVDKQDDFRATYVAAAREVGQLFLDQDDIVQAWPYFRTIGETQPIAEALEKVRPATEYDELNEQLIQIALYDGANPVKGLELLLKSHGTCNTVTALDQQMPQLSSEQRKRATVLMVNTIYDELRQTLLHEVQSRMPMIPPDSSVRDLVRGREWLFENGNYHIDVSHLNSVVRFARSLDKDAPELKKAGELALYGEQLDPQLQYASEPPFDEFYKAHRAFFDVISDTNRDEAIQFFEDKLAQEPDLEDQQLIAYVLVDVLLRCDRVERALELSEQFLMELGEQTGFSMTELCLETGHPEILERIARQKGDLIAYAAAVIQSATKDND